jgi:hypothetical protein
MKKFVLSVILMALSSSAMCDVANGQFVIKVLTPGVGVNPPEPTGVSCKDIKENHPDSKSGAYTINQAGRKIKTYCNMTLDGGGWTLVQLRANNLNRFTMLDDISSGQFVNGVGVGVGDDVWTSLAAKSTQLMMYYNDNGYAYMSLSVALNANCKRLSPNTLRHHLLWHDERRDCDMVNTDYSFMGHPSNGALKSSTYTYNGKYQKVLNVASYLGSNGKVFVR